MESQGASSFTKCPRFCIFLYNLWAVGPIPLLLGQSAKCGETCPSLRIPQNKKNCRGLPALVQWVPYTTKVASYSQSQSLRCYVSITWCYSRFESIPGVLVSCLDLFTCIAISQGFRNVLWSFVFFFFFKEYILELWQRTERHILFGR